MAACKPLDAKRVKRKNYFDCSHRVFSNLFKSAFDKISFLGKQIYMAFLQNAHKQTKEIWNDDTIPPI